VLVVILSYYDICAHERKHENEQALDVILITSLGFL
jgi:hypothetical protein